MYVDMRHQIQDENIIFYCNFSDIHFNKGLEITLRMYIMLGKVGSYIIRQQYNKVIHFYSKGYGIGRLYGAARP